MDQTILAETLRDFMPERSGEASLIHMLRQDRGPAPEQLDQLLQSLSLPRTNCFFVAVCVGVRADYAKTELCERYSEYAARNLALYRDLEREFRESGRGFEVYRTSTHSCILCVFPNEQEESFIKSGILPVVNALEARFDMPLCAGVGLPTCLPERLGESCDNAKWAFELWYFEPQQIIDFRDFSARQNYDYISAYHEAAERAFRAILTQDPNAMARILEAVDCLGRFHYGNRRGAYILTMQYAGFLCGRLKNYDLMDMDFFELQNRLQDRVAESTTFRELRAVVEAHFQELLPHVYLSDRPRGKLVVEQVKDYIREHYNEDLSIQRLARVAYVSPDYFSHMFKNETGKNYKTFLTEIRMQHAIELLRDTELLISEISEKVGYRTPRSFVDAFKQLYQISPMSYRKLQQHRK